MSDSTALPPQAQRAEFITMGCRLNIAETEAMKKLVPEGSNVVVVNSCAVTNEAVRQTRQVIRRAKRARPRCPCHRHRMRGANPCRHVRRHARSRPRARQP